MVPRSLRIVVSVLLLAVTATAADPPPTTVSATITLRDVNLAELVEKMNLDLGYKLGGKVTVVATVSAPLGEVAAANAYVLKGQVTSAEVSLDALIVRDLSAEIGYANGKLTLAKLTATVPSDVAAEPSGTISGSASAAIEPRGEAKASLTLSKLPVGPIFKTFLPGELELAGAVGGTLEVRAPVDKLSDPATWNGSGNLTAAALTFFGRSVRDTKLTFGVSDGKAVLTELAAVIEGVPVTGGGALALSGKYAYTANLRTAPKEVSELQKLVPELDWPVAIKGKLALDATGGGTLLPFTVTAGGSVTAAELAVGGATGEKLSAKWKATRERVTISDLSAGLFKGTFTGTADIPLRRDSKGEFKLTFEEIDAAAVAATFPKLPVRLTGVVSGGITGGFPAAKPTEARAISADVKLTAAKLTVQGIPAEKLVGKLTVEGTALRYELEGKTLGGSFEITGRYPEAKKEDGKDGGTVTVRSLDLGRLSRALRLRGTRLWGVVDLSLRHSSDLTEGDGRYRIRGLGVNDSLLFPELSGRLRLRNGSLELAESVGPLAGGTLRARVRARLGTPERNSYRLDIDRANLSAMFASLGARPDLLEGDLSLTARGRLWPQLTGTGSLILARGRLAGLTASDLRVPFQLSAISGGGFQLTVRDLNGTLGGGRVSGQFEFSGGASSRANGQLKFTSVLLGSVLSDLKRSNYFGTARVTGRIDLSGENMTSVDDLRGGIVATIEQAGVRDLPVLTAVLPFVSPTALVKPFDGGELRGRLSRGVFRVERLALSSPNAELFAEGNVTLTGRLDLGVIVRTGSVGVNEFALRQLGLTLPLTLGPIPVALIRDVSVFLSNRTVRLTIVGTVSAPRPQLNTAALLTEEAVRFFLRRYLPLAAEVLPEVSPRRTR